jgi:hypothetical protein
VKAATRKAIAKYWGYLLLLVIYFGWFVFHFGPAALAVGSFLGLSYFLFQAPVPCCAKNRDLTFCRNNAHGIIGGCHIKQHKWQNFKMLIHRQSWARLAQGLFRRVSGNAAAVGALASSMSAMVATITLIVK